MPSDEATERVVDESIAQAYAEWAASRAAVPADPYYSESRCRFEIREDDVLRTVGDVVVGPAECGVRISSKRARAGFDVCGLAEAETRAAVAAIDGARTAAEVRSSAGIRAEAWRKLVATAFGTVVLAPRSVVECESGISGAEIVRYPGSPYEIVRGYWSNMAAVAERIRGAGAEVTSTAVLIRFLRELHVLALTGKSGSSFYLPASPVTRSGRLFPGELWAAPSVVEPVAGEPGSFRFVSGPRVNASAIGGPEYQWLLSATTGGAKAAEPSSNAKDDPEPAWGRVVVARADHDESASPWFCPPRPFAVDHFHALGAAYREALQAAERADRTAVLASLARLHWYFIRLHPFRAGNQCIAMSLVNHVLRKSHGAGIPHLILDHLALQLSPGAYAAVFALAVDAWLVADDRPLERYLELIARRDRCFDFLRKLGEAPDHSTAARLVESSPDEARLALIDPSASGPLNPKPET